ncbi:MAG: hypothetical protein OXI60_08950 [Acidiferrobacterales bacterium]|nr:hypothetical protein [Acidiferrobacterales bacterium]
MKSLTKLLVLVLAGLLVSGCGFQLRGSDGSSSTMSVNYDYSITIRTANPEFRLKLAESLAGLEFNVVGYDGDYLVEVFDEQYTEDDFEDVDDSLTLNIKTLEYSIQFRLKEPGQDEMMVSQTIELRLDYSNFGDKEVARDVTTKDALRRSREKAAQLLAHRLVAIIQGQ